MFLFASVEWFVAVLIYYTDAFGKRMCNSMTEDFYLVRFVK